MALRYIKLVLLNNCKSRGDGLFLAWITSICLSRTMKPEFVSVVLLVRRIKTNAATIENPLFCRNVILIKRQCWFGDPVYFGWRLDAQITINNEM